MNSEGVASNHVTVRNMNPKRHAHTHTLTTTSYRKGGRVWGSAVHELHYTAHRRGVKRSPGTETETGEAGERH